MAPATIPELAKNFQSGDFIHYIKLHHTPKDCDVINDLTKGQSFSPAWKEYRLGRITASRAHRIIKCRGNGEYITRDILGESTFRGNTATEHGIICEGLARKLYEESHCRVETSGLVVNPGIPYIGASPDGIVNCSRCGYGILEIKCPYEYRYCQPLEAIHMMPCTRLGERVYYVNENSSWYSQAQVQLLCTNANFCDFVIYTFKGIAVTRIYPDSKWWIDNVQTLEKFFIEKIVPRLCK